MSPRTLARVNFNGFLYGYYATVYIGGKGTPGLLRRIGNLSWQIGGSTETPFFVPEDGIPDLSRTICLNLPGINNPNNAELFTVENNSTVLDEKWSFGKNCKRRKNSENRSAGSEKSQQFSERTEEDSDTMTRSAGWFRWLIPTKAKRTGAFFILGSDE